MVSQFSLAQMASDANYPSNTGITVSQSSTLFSSFANPVFCDVDLLVAGTPGTGSPSYQVQVQLTAGGSWFNLPQAVLTGAGHVHTRAFGVAFRLAAANGTTPGTGANTPRFHLGVRPLKVRYLGK